MSDRGVAARAYVAALRASGQRDSDIARALRQAGWTRAQVRELLHPPPPPAPRPSLEPQAVAGEPEPAQAESALPPGPSLLGPWRRHLLGLLVLAVLVVSLLAILLPRPSPPRPRPRPYQRPLPSPAPVYPPGWSAAPVPYQAPAPPSSGPDPRVIDDRIVTNLRLLTHALLMYAADNHQQLPCAQDWPQRIYPYVKNRDAYLYAYRPPLLQHSGSLFTDFTMNEYVSELNLTRVPHRNALVLLFTGIRLHGLCDCASFTSSGVVYVSYADGALGGLDKHTFTPELLYQPGLPVTPLRPPQSLPPLPAGAPR